MLTAKVRLIKINFSSILVRSLLEMTQADEKDIQVTLSKKP